ncbi:MAG: hypothetical protein Kow0069_05730 [Promethearchaeota archaeon]
METFFKAAGESDDVDPINEKGDEYVVESFVLEPGDRGKFVELIREAFVEDAGDVGGTIAFDEETFDLMYGSPKSPRDMFVRALHEPTGRVVGFLGGIPRDLSVGGRVYKFGVPSWAAVHPAHQKRGLALRMGLKLLELAKEKGFDGGLAFFEPEAHGIDAARSLARRSGLKYSEILTIRRFVIRVFDVARTASVAKLRWYERLGLRLLSRCREPENPHVRPYRPGDAPALHRVAVRQAERCQLAMVRDVDDLEWYLGHPLVNCVVHEGDDGEPDGFIVAWRFLMAGFGRAVPFGWLDLVHLDGLPADEARDVATALCWTSRRRGWAGLQAPLIPYFDPSPFKRAKFVFYPKSLVVGAFMLGDVQLPEKVDSFYFDWR